MKFGSLWAHRESPELTNSSWCLIRPPRLLVVRHAGLQDCEYYGCRNVTIDPNNCGGCGNGCDQGAACVDGVCTCPAGESKPECFLLVKDDRTCWESDWFHRHELIGLRSTFVKFGSLWAHRERPELTNSTWYLIRPPRLLVVRHAGLQVCGEYYGCTNVTNDPDNCGGCANNCFEICGCPEAASCDGGVCFCNDSESQSGCMLPGNALVAPVRLQAFVSMRSV